MKSYIAQKYKLTLPKPLEKGLLLVGEGAIGQRDREPRFVLTNYNAMSYLCMPDI